jgi:hydrogenase maturation factor HypF (carbamoyltransferase family)
MAINHNRATIHITSPYDDAILILNNKLNRTYVSYGNKGLEKMQLQAEQDSKANDYSKANAVGRAVSKSSHLYKNSSWDLVDAVENEEVVIENLNQNELPQELKGKSKEDVEAYLTKKQLERKAINKDIQELNAKRKQYISEQQNDAKNGLENAMINAIKTQAKKKNYQWN